MNFKAAELMQYLLEPPGPLLNTCPKWEFDLALLTSTRVCPYEKSLFFVITFSLIGFENEGQPQFDLNLS